MCVCLRVCVHVCAYEAIVVDKASVQGLALSAGASVCMFVYVC